MTDDNYVDPSLLQLITDRKQTIWLRIGSLHESMNSPDRALSAYEACLSHNQYNVDALIKAGLLHMRKESIVPAINYLLNAVNLDPESGAAWGALAYSYVMADEFDKAYYAYYNTLHKLADHRDPNLWFGIGTLYDRLGMLDSALTAFNAVIEMDPAFDRLDEVLYSMGLIHKEQGNYNASYDCMAKIVSISSSTSAQAEAWYQLGTLHDITGVVTTASEAYQNALSRNQNHVKGMQALAWLMHKGGEDNDAVDMLQRAARCEETNAESYYLIGRIYMANNEFRVAYDNYQRAVHLDGKNPYFWCSIASLYYHREQHLDAIDAYSKAIQINPDMPDVWFDLGTLYEMYNQLNDAMNSYRRALHLQPNNSLISQRIQAVKQCMIGGASSSRPSGKPSCDAPETSPTTRSGQRLHYKSDAPSRYGNLPAPPSPAPLTEPGMAAQHSRTGGRAADIPVNGALPDDRHSHAATVPVGAGNSSSAIPVDGRPRVANDQGDSAPLAASNVTVTGPESDPNPTFSQLSEHNVPTVTRPMSQGPVLQEKQSLGAPPTNSGGLGGPTKSPQTKLEGGASPTALRLPSSRPKSTTPLSPKLRTIERSPQDAKVAEYSHGQASNQEVTSSPTLHNGPGCDLSPRGTLKLQATPTNGAINQDTPSRSENDWANRNGKTGTDNLGTRTNDNKDGAGTSTADALADVQRTEDQNAAFTSYPGSVLAKGSALKNLADTNQIASRGIPVSLAPLAVTAQPSRERNPSQQREQYVDRQKSAVGTAALGNTSSPIENAPPRDEPRETTGKANSEASPSRDLGVNSAPSPLKNQITNEPASGGMSASRGSTGKTEHVDKSVDGNQTPSDTRGNARCEYHPPLSVGTPVDADRYGISTSSVKDDSPLDEEMLPRLPPLPSNNNRQLCQQNKDSIADGGEQTGENSNDNTRLDQAENEQCSEIPASGGEDSIIRGNRARSTQGQIPRPAQDTTLSSPSANDTHRLGGQRTGFNAIIQEPTTQSRLFKSTGFPDFRTSREEMLFTNSSKPLPQDDGLQKGLKRTFQNGDFDHQGRQVASSTSAGIRNSPDVRSPGVHGAPEEIRDHGGKYAITPSQRTGVQTGANTGAPSSSKASPEHRSFGNNTRFGVQSPYDNSSHDKTDKNLTQRAVPSTGIRSSPTIGGGGLSIKRGGFQRNEEKNTVDKTDRDSPTDSHKMNRVSSLRNPFGSGISPSFAKPAPRSGGMGSLGFTAVKEPSVHESSGRPGASEGLNSRGETGGGESGPRRDAGRDQASVLGKRRAASFEGGKYRSGEGGEPNRFIPKSAVMGPPMESGMRASDVEIREPRFLGSSSQYAPNRSGNQEVKRDKKGEQEGYKRFNNGEM